MNLISLQYVKTVQGFYFLPKLQVNKMLALLDHLQNKRYVQTDQQKTQPTFTCSKSTIETFEEVVKYVQR